MLLPQFVCIMRDAVPYCSVDGIMGVLRILLLNGQIIAVFDVLGEHAYQLMGLGRFRRPSMSGSHLVRLYYVVFIGVLGSITRIGDAD